MIISLSAKGQFGIFHCIGTWNSTELMRLSDAPQTKENSAGSNFDFQVAHRVTPVIRLQQSCFLHCSPHHSCCWTGIFFMSSPTPFLSSMPWLSDSDKMRRPSLCPSHGFPFPRCVSIPRTPRRTHCFSWTRDFNAIPAPFLACSTCPTNTWRAKEQERPEKRARGYICVEERTHHSQKWLRVAALSVQD